jgi:hypothetical protein
MRLVSAWTTCEVSDIYNSKSITITYEDGEFEIIDKAHKRGLRWLEKW